jgi:hypothetical protein
MDTNEKIDQLQNKIIANYKDQIDLLKSINETNNTIIDSQKNYIIKLEEYIQNIKGQLETFEILLKL